MSAVTLSGVVVEVLTSEAQAEELRNEWRQLWQQANLRTVFQRPEWLLPWWRHLGQGELHILCARRDGRLVGLLPLSILREDFDRRTVQLLGSGVTDYLDALASPEAELDVCSAFYDYLHADSAPWDVCDFQQLRAGSLLLNRFRHEGWRDEITVQEVCPTLKLPNEVGRLRESVPPNMLQKLAYYRRRMSKTGQVEVSQADKSTFDEFFTAFVNLHRARWNNRQQPGVLASPEVHQFMWEACSGFLASGHLRLYALRSEGRIVGTLCAFHESTRTFYYLSGFAPEASTLSPGTLMIGHAIEQAIREGANEFDFLRGRETYKYMWGAKGRLNYRRRLSRAPATVPSTPQPSVSELIPT